MIRAASAWLTLGLLAAAPLVRGEAPAPSFDWNIWRGMVALDGGRSKPVDTLAWEEIYSFAGRSRWKPTTTATVSVADIPDWPKLAAALTQKTGPTAELSATLPAGLAEQLSKTSFDTSPLEAELFDIDQKMAERRDAYVIGKGLDKTLAQFRVETQDPEDRKLIAKFDDLLAKIDAVGRVKVDVIHHLNESEAVGRLVPTSLVKEAAGKRTATDLDRAIARRRYLEQTLSDSITPLPSSAVPSQGLAREDRKYDPVEFAVTLLLTWNGWDKVDAIRQALEQPSARNMPFDQLYWEMHSPDLWDATPIADARFQDLAPKLQGDTATSTSMRTVHANRWFIRWALRIAGLEEVKAEKKTLSTADKKSVDVLRAYRSYVELRTGQSFILAPDRNVKLRIDYIKEKLADLAKAVEGKTGSGLVSAIESWKGALPANDPYVSDVKDVADGLARDLKLSSYGDSPVPFADILATQQRTKIDPIINEARWLSVFELLVQPKGIENSGYEPARLEAIRKSLLDARAGLLANDPAAFNTASRSLADQLADAASQSQLYPAASLIQSELHYNKFQPFLWTVVLSGLALVMLVLSLGMKGSLLYRLGFVTLLIGVGFMIYGMTMRIMISGRPPVTNMYETIIWASFIMTTLAVVLGLVYRHRVIMMTAALALTPATLLAYVMPPEFGSSIEPLVPVLRDNFWLVIHVLTIVASYGALMLAWMLGNVGLTYYLFGTPAPSTVKPIAQFCYRAMQVGVLLLGAGTLLGGWWAAYSWGRFWGWDPKEVFALVAFIGYIIVLHARLLGLLKTFGLLAMSVVAFVGVVMSWYGVNFVLGEGLHAYAFGDGGQPYVLGTVLANLAYVGLVVFVRSSRRKGSAESPSESAEFTAAGA